MLHLRIREDFVHTVDRTARDARLLEPLDPVRGRLLAARSELLRLLRGGSVAEAERSDAEAALREVEARLSHLRLSLEGGLGDEIVVIDGRQEVTAGLGYDVPLDPGEHELRALRAGRVLVERGFVTREGELLRLEIVLPR